MASYLALLLFLFFVLLLTLLVSRRQRLPALRPIAAFDALPDQIGQAAESGRTLHISLGTGGIGGGDTVTSLTGLSALAHLAEQGVATDTPPLVTVSDPTLLPLAQNILRQAYARRGRSDDFSWTQVRLVSPSPIAYALGTRDLLSHEPILDSPAGDKAGLVQISGSDDPLALSILYATTDRVVIGEELYATDAYLNRTAAKLISLAAEDVARTILILFIILFALFRLAGVR